MPALLPSKTTPQRTDRSSPDFRTRQRSLTDRLDFLQRSLNLRDDDPMDMDVDNLTERQRQLENRRSTRPLRGQESIFKVPALPPLRNRMPDFRRNPSRWTRYSLADVSSADMSDRSNTAAALSFLHSLHTEPQRVELPQSIKFNSVERRRQPRERTEESDEPEPGPSRPTIGFGDPCPPVECAAPVPTFKPVYKSNKLIMPEYVVGKKIEKPKKVTRKTPRGKELSLSHLLEQEDE